MSKTSIDLFRKSLYQFQGEAIRLEAEVTNLKGLSKYLILTDQRMMVREEKEALSADSKFIAFDLICCTVSFEGVKIQIDARRSEVIRD